MAASKISFAKERMDYRKKPNQCSTCNHYPSERHVKKAENSWNTDWVTEKNKRCGIGRFAVQSSAVCDHWQRKVACQAKEAD